MEGQREYLTPQDVAEMLKVHTRTVLRWVSGDASMPAIRIGRRIVRFEKVSLLRWLARKRPPTAGTQGDAATE